MPLYGQCIHDRRVLLPGFDRVNVSVRSYRFYLNRNWFRMLTLLELISAKTARIQMRSSTAVFHRRPSDTVTNRISSFRSWPNELLGPGRLPAKSQTFPLNIRTLCTNAIFTCLSDWSTLWGAIYRLHSCNVMARRTGDGYGSNLCWLPPQDTPHTPHCWRLITIRPLCGESPE